MNGTVIDIAGITINVNSVCLECSSDKANILIISDGSKIVTIDIAFGKIINVNEKNSSSK